MMANSVHVMSACIAWFYLLVSLPCLSKKEVLSLAEEELSNCPFNHKLREVLTVIPSWRCWMCSHCNRSVSWRRFLMITLILLNSLLQTSRSSVEYVEISFGSLRSEFSQFLFQTSTYCKISTMLLRMFFSSKSNVLSFSVKWACSGMNSEQPQLVVWNAKVFDLVQNNTSTTII